MTASYQDNRSAAEVSEWLHAEVKALRERVRQLEDDKLALIGALEGVCEECSADLTELVTHDEALRKAVQG